MLVTLIRAGPSLNTCNPPLGAEEVPIPTEPSTTNILVTVATPTVRSSMSTSAVDVSDAAVVAVPVKLPVTSPVIPPIKLDDATAFAVKIPTITSGVPTNPSAPVAIPVTLPVRLPENPPVAVTIPEIETSAGNLELSRIGSLSLEIVPNSILSASSNVNSDPIPV